MRIGIRREDKNQWEARVPLTPGHIRELRNRYQIEFLIQPSAIRTFSDDEYRRAGAVVQEDLSECDIVFAVKEIPLNFFLLGKKYVFFSHTIKGQSYNMPRLKRMVDLKTTLIDYEKIVDENGRRLMFFGRFAGIAGMIDSFWALGGRLKNEGFDTVFSQLKQALDYSGLESIKAAYRKQAKTLAQDGFPEALTPLIFGFTGYGNVSRGAQEMFDIFPHIEIQPEELAEFYRKGKFSDKHLYKVVFKEEHLVKPKDSTAKFNLQDYYHHPEKYESKFEQYLSYLSVLINAIYWDTMYPKLVTRRYLKERYESGTGLPLKIIGDITCDIGGSIECNMFETNSGNPVYVYDPIKEEIQYGTKGNGPVVLAVDNLPCELPKESSTVFSTVLKEFIPALLETDFSLDFDNVNLPVELKRATILYNGEFTPDFEYMREFIKNL
jgi:alpha-aminoadipic semialdehyde synthase